MKKFFLFILLGISIIIACCSCNRNNEESVNKPTITLMDMEYELGYSIDSSVFNAYKNYKPVFRKDQARVWFVSKWNTPSLYIADHSITLIKIWDGCMWDGCMFYGFLNGDYVYYPSTYKFYSEKYAKEVGQETIVIEKGFPKDGVTTDVRQTCWWISFVMDLLQNDSTDVKLNEFIKTATCYQSSDNEFNEYLKDLETKILSMPGKNNKQKIINYTAQVLPGSPKNWDAWNYPGYYQSR